MGAFVNARKAGLNSAAKKAAYIEGLKLGLTSSEAAGLAGVNKRTPTDWRKVNKEFAAQCQRAAAEGVAHLAKEARRRAVEGVRKPVLHKGKQVFVFDETSGDIVPLFENSYSDTLLMFLMKSRDPENYDDRVRAEKLFRKWRKADGGDDAGAITPSDVIDLLAQLATAKQAQAGA
jgi:hypothetical protein